MDRVGRANNQQRFQRESGDRKVPMRETECKRENKEALQNTWKDFQPRESGNNPQSGKKARKKTSQPSRYLSKEVWHFIPPSETILRILRIKNLSLPASMDICPEQWFISLTHHWIPDQSVRNEDKGFKGAHFWGSWVRGLGVQ
jgi:hypothetical protein